MDIDIKKQVLDSDEKKTRNTEFVTFISNISMYRTNLPLLKVTNSYQDVIDQVLKYSLNILGIKLSHLNLTRRPYIFSVIYKISSLEYRDKYRNGFFLPTNPDDLKKILFYDISTILNLAKFNNSDITNFIIDILTRNIGYRVKDISFTRYVEFDLISHISSYLHVIYKETKYANMYIQDLVESNLFYIRLEGILDKTQAKLLPTTLVNLSINMCKNNDFSHLTNLQSLIIHQIEGDIILPNNLHTLEIYSINNYMKLTIKVPNTIRIIVIPNNVTITGDISKVIGLSLYRESQIPVTLESLTELTSLIWMTLGLPRLPLSVVELTLRGGLNSDISYLTNLNRLYIHNSGFGNEYKCPMPVVPNSVKILYTELPVIMGKSVTNLTTYLAINVPAELTFLQLLSGDAYTDSIKIMIAEGRYITNP